MGKDKFETLLLDARPVNSFNQGHIPSSVNFLFPDLLDTKDGVTKFRTVEEMNEMLKNHGIALKYKQYITSCMSVVSACVVFFSLVSFFGVPLENVKLYDGSFSRLARTGTQTSD